MAPLRQRCHELRIVSGILGRIHDFVVVYTSPVVVRSAMTTSCIPRFKAFDPGRGRRRASPHFRARCEQNSPTFLLIVKLKVSLPKVLNKKV